MYQAAAQDSTVRKRHLNGAISVTHNGIALVPTFSLEKPAALFLFSYGGDRFSFDPDIRFSLEGKPWSMLFWFRYKLITGKPYRLTIGAHPALNFRSTRLPVNGDSANVTLVRRFLAGELNNQYLLGKNFTAGIYYLYARGFDVQVPRNNHFLALTAGFNKLRIAGNLYLNLNPQVFYLRQDKLDGWYTTLTIGISHKKFPLSLSGIFNQRIKSDIAGKELVWNTSLVYSFTSNWYKKRQ